MRSSGALGGQLARRGEAEKLAARGRARPTRRASKTQRTLKDETASIVEVEEGRVLRGGPEDVAAGGGQWVCSGCDRRRWDDELPRLWQVCGLTGLAAMGITRMPTDCRLGHAPSYSLGRVVISRDGEVPAVAASVSGARWGLAAGSDGGKEVSASRRVRGCKAAATTNARRHRAEHAPPPPRLQSARPDAAAPPAPTSPTSARPSANDHSTYRKLAPFIESRMGYDPAWTRAGTSAARAVSAVADFIVLGKGRSVMGKSKGDKHEIKSSSVGFDSVSGGVHSRSVEALQLRDVKRTNER